MKGFLLRTSVFLLCIALLGGGATFSLFGQARRLPPTSDEKKNKRPPQGQEQGQDKEQPEPVPTDIAGKETESKFSEEVQLRLR